MKVLLINPPAADGVEMVREGRCMQRRSAWGAVWPPISLAGIAAMLELKGYDCRISDCIVEKINLEQLSKIAREFAPRMIIVNTATPSIKSDLAAVDRLKQVLPETRIFAIGIHPTALPEATIEMSRGLDGVIRGEPEAVALELAELIRYNRGWRQAPGIGYKDGLLFYNTIAPQPLALDSMPFPAWHLVKKEHYRMPMIGEPFLLIAVSRGCPFNCEFCADATYYGKKLRLKSPAKIVKEMDWCKTKFGVKDFLFWAESSTIKPDWTMEVADAVISSGLKVRFVINSRPDGVSPPLLQKLKAAGCWMIGYGLESGSDEMLKLMGKGLTVEQCRSAVTMAKQAGLAVTGHFVLGFPGETRESAGQTVKFAMEEPVDFAQFYCAVPFPGSKLYERARKQGMIVTDDWARFEQNFSVISTSTLSAEELAKIREEAYLKFYFAPAKMMNFARLAWNLGGFKNLRELSREFRGWMQP